METSNLYYSDEYCDIGYNSMLGAVQSRWKGLFVSGERFRLILDKLIELLGIKQSYFIIADAREMKEIIPEDQQWIVNSWYPRAVRAGFKYEIIIVSKASYSELAIKDIVKNHYDDKLVKTVYLTDPESVNLWVGHFSGDVA